MARHFKNDLDKNPCQIIFGKIENGGPWNWNLPQIIWEKKMDNVVLVVEKQTCIFRDKEAFDWVLGVAVDFLDNVLIIWKHYHWYLKKTIWFLNKFKNFQHKRPSNDYEAYISLFSITVPWIQKVERTMYKYVCFPRQQF